MEIEEQIIDIDGSCRDINFPDVSSSEAVSLFEYINNKYKLLKATDTEGEEVSSQEAIELLNSSSSQNIISIWECTGILSQIQLFYSWQNKSKIFIELTIFPQDFNSEVYSLKEFKIWLKPILIALNTNIFYVRYENASWKYGDTSQDSGVIFTNKECKFNG